MKKLQIFNQNHWPLAKCKFFPFLILHFYSVERLIFYVERYKRLCMGLFDLKNKEKKFKIVDHNNGLTPLEKFKFCHFFNLTFWLSKKANFLSRTSWKTFMGLFPYFYRLEWLIFNLEHHERLFQGIWSKR